MDQASASIAQRSKYVQQSKYVPVSARQRKQADSWREPARRRTLTARTAPGDVETKEEIEICTAYKVYSPSRGATSRCDALSICLYFQSR